MTLAHAWADQMRVQPLDAMKKASISGTLFIAEEQTAGRGRLQRRWETPYGTALLCSLLLYPPHLPQPVTQTAMLAAVSVVRALRNTYPALHDRVTLKWPNDVLLRNHPRNAENGASNSAPLGVQHTQHPAVQSDVSPTDTRRSVQNAAIEDEYGKVAGILCELSFRQNQPDYAVVGIGINVNQSEGELPPAPERGSRPTSLRLCLGHRVDRTDLLIALCREMSHFVTTTPTGPSLWREWRGQLGTLGRRVTVRSGVDQAVLCRGEATDVTEAGDLIITDDTGVQHTFSAGEVSLR